MFEIFVLIVFVFWVLAKFIEVQTLVEISRKLTKVDEKEEKPKRVHSNVAKAAYNSPLKTYKEYDRYKDKKTGLYEPVKPNGRGIKIKGDDEE